MAETRVLSVTEYDFWGASEWTPAGEYIADSWPVPFHLLQTATIEVRINMIVWAAGNTIPDTRVRFRLGGTAELTGIAAFVSEAQHGALVAEFNVAAAHKVGPYWTAPAPTFNQDNAKLFGGVFTVSKPADVAYVRASTFSSALDQGVGFVALRMDFRNSP